MQWQARVCPFEACRGPNLHDSKLINELDPQRRFWPYAAAVAVMVIVAAAIRWSLDNPRGIHWDEAEYFNFVHIDLQRLLAGDVLRLGGRILIKSWGRPPLFRILALPFLALFRLFHTTVARFVSLLCYGGSSLFVYLATRRIASPVAGAFSVLIFALSPEVVSASIFFGTDASLYLATSALLYYVFTYWNDPSNDSRAWIGLGLSIGFGLLAKTSFLAIGFPVLAFWIACDWLGYLSVPRIAPQRKAGALALLIAGPWWLFNFKAAFAYSQYARGFVRNSLGPPSFATWMRWLNTVLQCLLGHAISILIGLIAIAAILWVILHRGEEFPPLQKAALGACAIAGGPIVLMQLSGTNHLLRHISPAVIPLAIALGIVADRIGWFRSRLALGLSGALCCCQLVMLLIPAIFPNNHALDIGFNNGSLPWRVFIRFDQWDWSRVRDLSDSCGLETPKISYLGNSRAFNPPQIETPWVPRPAGSPGVIWLWRYEEGPLDWQKVMDAAAQNDLVLTAPHYLGNQKNKEDLDNQHNAEFENRLSKEARFQGPIRLEMGRFEPVEVDVFLNKSLVCRLPQPGSVNH